MARILVVEDNRTNLELMTYLLRAFGHDPHGVTDSAEGLEIARSGQYDLVISDVLMPGMDGFAFARKFRADPELKDGKLIAVTALAMVGDRERLLAAGFDGYIAKPIDPQVFVGQVESYMGETRSKPAGTVSSKPPATDGSARKGPVILMVDDVRLNIQVVRAALDPFGYQIMEAKDISEAWVRMREQRPSLVLCDLHMPGENGFKLVTEMKASAEFRDIPFIFLSSTSWLTRDKERGLELGAAGFLHRPIDPLKLLQEVHAALKGVPVGQNPRR